MEPTVTGTPLDALQATFLDLTAKIEADILSVDEAMDELHNHEVVDATGHNWRIDPMSQWFARCGPSTNSTWQPADPSEFATQAPPGVATAPPVPADTPEPVADSLLPMKAPEPEAVRGGSRRNLRGLAYAVAGLAVVILIAAVAFQPAQQDSKRPAKAAPSPSAPHKTPPGVLSEQNPVPKPERRSVVLEEITSGDVKRISAVAEKSQYGAGGQRLYAATYSGWIKAGLRIKLSEPAGDPAGENATQMWELRDKETVLAVANVAWHRTDEDGWRLTEWPQFHPAS